MSETTGRTRQVVLAEKAERLVDIAQGLELLDLF